MLNLFNLKGEFCHKLSQGFKQVISNFSAKRFENVFVNSKSAPRTRFIVQEVEKPAEELVRHIEMNKIANSAQNDVRMRKFSKKQMKKYQKKVQKNSAILRQRQRLLASKILFF